MKQILAPLLAVACVAGGTAARTALAGPGESYPERPITLVVPYPAGAAVDAVGRQVGAVLQRALGQPVVIENRAGAGSQIGTAHVTKAAADGHTLLITTLDALTLLPMVRELPYRPERDLTAIARVARAPYGIQVNPALGIGKLEDLLAQARLHPGTLRYGSTGNGSLAHVAMEAFAARAGIALVHVPYRGMAASVNDLIAGHIDLGLVSMSTAAPYMQAGRIQAIALMTQAPSPLWPGIPDLRGAGIEGLQAELEFVLVAPSGTPAGVLQRVGRAVEAASADGAYADSLDKLHLAPAYLDAAALAQRWQDDAQAWAAILQAVSIPKDSP